MLRGLLIMTTTSSNTNKVVSEAEQALIDKRRGRFMPWLIIAFFVGFIAILINFVMIAVANKPSEVTQHAYAKGLAYNQIIAAQEAQDALAWKALCEFKSGQLHYQLKDAKGVAIDGARVKAWFVSPANADKDQAHELIAVGSGHYVAKADLAKGLWQVHITSMKDGKQFQSVLDVEVK